MAEKVMVDVDDPDWEAYQATLQAKRKTASNALPKSIERLARTVETAQAQLTHVEAVLAETKAELAAAEKLVAEGVERGWV
jgi:multidrug resistance efflux pump